MDQYGTKIDLLRYMLVSDLYFIVIDLDYLYTLRNGPAGGFMPLQALALVLYVIYV